MLDRPPCTCFGSHITSIPVECKIVLVRSCHVAAPYHMILHTDSTMLQERDDRNYVRRTAPTQPEWITKDTPRLETSGGRRVCTA